MGLRKGMTNNPDGRPRGAQNKVTKVMRETIQQLFDNNLEQLEQDIKELEPIERVKALTNLLPYILPRLQSTELVSEGTKLDRLSNDEINELANNILKQ